RLGAFQKKLFHRYPPSHSHHYRCVVFEQDCQGPGGRGDRTGDDRTVGSREDTGGGSTEVAVLRTPVARVQNTAHTDSGTARGNDTQDGVRSRIGAATDNAIQRAAAASIDQRPDGIVASQRRRTES